MAKYDTTRNRAIVAFSGTGLACSAMLCAALGMPASAYAAITLDDDGKVNMFGDVRFRAEWDDSEKQDGTTRDRNRLRYRARLGVAFQPNDQWSGKIRLATTSNQNAPHVDFTTIGDTADTSIGVDIAYIAYTGVNDLTVIVGKTPLNFWQQTEVFWDNDITPEGLAVVYNAGPVTLNAAYAVLEEGGWEDDMTLVTYQAVFGGGDAMKYTLAAGGASVDDPLNTLNAESHWVVNGQLKSGAWLVGADYLQSDADEEDTAYVVQGRYKFGDSPFGIRLYYYSVETNATPGDGLFTQDNFPSAEAAADNFDGYRLQLDYKVAKNTSIDVRYYDTEIITEGVDEQDAKRSRLQANFNVKF